MADPRIDDARDDNYRGLNETRRLLDSYDKRVSLYAQLKAVGLFHDLFVRSVHVDNSQRADRCELTAYNFKGSVIRACTVFRDEPAEELVLVPEFSSMFTNMTVQPDSELAEMVDKDGWIIDMMALRTYDPVTDRQATQREIFLSIFPDVMQLGMVRGFMSQRPEDFTSEA